MPYYLQGDYGAGYYRGRGDPGLFGFLGTAVKTVGGFLSGGISGAVRAVTGAGPVLQGPTYFQAPQAPRGPAPVGRPGGIPLPGPIRIRPTRMLPGGKPGIEFEGGSCPPGFHLDKRTKTYCVRNRRMNPANPRALRRGIRREKAFIALARRALTGTGITIGRRSFAKKTARRR